MTRPDVSIIILTYNEQANIAGALESVCGWARDVFVVDSFSKDRTLGVAAQYKCNIVQNTFSSFSQQFNWALESLPMTTEWIFFLDADERMPSELKSEVESVIASVPAENGFALRMKFIWMGRWVRRGYHSRWFMRLVRRDKARWESREINPHLQVEGRTGRLRSSFVHDDQKGLREWTEKHVAYARLEAQQLLASQTSESYMQPKFFGSPQQRVRWIRMHIYNRMPPLVRPVCYFFYRLVIVGGFLDGWQAWIYHFLHALWCPLLIDLFYLELKKGGISHSVLAFTRSAERDQP